MPIKNGLAFTLLVASVLFGGFLQAEAEHGPITPLPEERDSDVYAGPVDVRYSREWWRATHHLFRQAHEENDTATVVMLAQEMAGGWLYNANMAYRAVKEGISYLRRLGEDRHPEDLIALIRARAEVAQYVGAVNQRTRDSLWIRIICADHEISQVYRASGNHVFALHALESYYREQQEHRARLRSAPYRVVDGCPLDEVKILSELLEAYSVVALTTAPDPATAQGYLEAAMSHGETLRALVEPEQAFRWGNPTGEEAYGNPVWSIDSLLLFLARTIGIAPDPYVELVAALSKENTVRDPFTYSDAIAGREYLTEHNAGERLITKLYDTYHTLFLGWEEAESSFEYQGNSLSYLSFAIEQGLTEKAKEIIGQLAGLRFADPVHSERFTRLQFAFQRAHSVSPAGLPMGNLVEGVLQAMQGGAAIRSDSTVAMENAGRFTTTVFMSFVQRHLFRAYPKTCFSSMRVQPK